MTMTEDKPTTEIERHSGFDRGLVLRYLDLDESKVETQAMLAICERYDLDPVMKHVILIAGRGNETARPYVTRDGYLHVAHETGQLDGIVVEDTGRDGDHWWADVEVYRKDMSRPFRFRGRFPVMRNVKKWVNTNNGGRTQKWVDEEHPYGPEMAVKCAEVAALRRAFDVSGMAAADEVWDSGEPIDVGSAEVGSSGPSVTEVENPVSDRIRVKYAALPEDARETIDGWLQRSKAPTVAEITDRESSGFLATVEATIDKAIEKLGVEPFDIEPAASDDDTVDAELVDEPSAKPPTVPDQDETSTVGETVDVAAIESSIDDKVAAAKAKQAKQADKAEDESIRSEFEESS